MSARDLTVRQMDKVVKQLAGEITDPKKLNPDEMRLYSYYRPSLVAGEYTISAQHTISSPSKWSQQNLTINNTIVEDGSGTDEPQVFEVMVPRFSLDSDLVNSYYPPDGHQDECRILPHIVFNDPHYPWEILAGTAESLKHPIDPHKFNDDKGNERVIMRNLVPWVALLVFDPEELHITDVTELSDLGIAGFTKEEDLKKQDPEGVFTMSVNDYLNLPNGSRINYRAGFPVGKEGDEAYAKLASGNVNVILPSKELFKSIFGTTGSMTDEGPSVQAHKYLAHVRHINTIGFPDAGVAEEGLFSIVVSSRTGKLDIDQPHTQICHLVSIEHVDATLGDWMSGGMHRMAMVSLFSWIYTALHPNPVNFVDTVRNLVSHQQMLNIDPESLGKMDPSAKGQTVVSTRLRQGYTLSRWRTGSGEETAAFNRGPLVPSPVTYPVATDIPDCSNTSEDYQILDPETGLIDLSYSSAWQIGKLLAISDTTFSSALMRFRSLVYNSSVHQTQMDISSMSTKGQSIAAMLKLTSNLRIMTAGQTNAPDRFRPPTMRAFAPALSDPDVKLLVQNNMQDSVKFNASAGVGRDAAGNATGKEIYNEFNLDKGNNSDWAVVHAWICEKLCLGGIPPHYLIPEPSFLPPESLRWFHIDDFWLDCFLDGALSVANHLDSDDDVTRRQMKQVFNEYLQNPVPRAGYKPQVPCYGFFIRSKLIKAIPDLRITLTWKPVLDSQGHVITDNRASVCRWTKWDDETLMALLDRQPQELQSVVLAQPPHQQRFSLGSYIKKGNSSDGTHENLIEFDLRRLYTKTTSETKDEWPEKPMADKALASTWLNFDTRVIKVSKMANDLKTNLVFSDPNGEAYMDPIPNSCMVGMELNDPSYYFLIKPSPPDDSEPKDSHQRDRRLYVDSSGRPHPNTQIQTTLKALRSRPSPPQQQQLGVPILKTTDKSTQPKAAPTQTLKAFPLPIQKPPNSQTRLQPISTARLATNFKAGAGKLTSSTQFKLQIYPDYKTSPHRYTSDKYDSQDYIPSLNIYLFDLIFSILKPTPSQQDLLRIDIDIPMRVDPPKEAEALLEGNYYGPGLRMLSNQRFIPFLYYNETKEPGSNADNLHIELIPRSADDGVSITLDDSKTAEISFRLAEAPISKLEKLTNVNVDGNQVSRGRVVVNMTEWYRTANYPKGEPVITPYELLKRAVTDDKDWDAKPV